MRYLVTGGAGFIGSHLVERLLEDGHQVDVIDDLSTGSASNLDAARGPNLRLTVDTVFNESATAALIDACDAVFHLAAAVGVMLIVERPVRTIETNIRATEVVLRHAARRGKPVLLASTSEVYGKSTRVPFREDSDLVLGPPSRSRWSYAASKLVDEFLALAYAREHRLPVVVARLFNTVGPRQTGRYGMVVPRFVQQAIAGGPLTVFGDGRQTRCFCHVSDVVDALARLLAAPRAHGQVFNVGSSREIAIRALADRVRRRVNPKAKVRLVPYARAYEEGFEDMRRRMPDVARIRRAIGWRARHSIDEIIDDVARFERSRPGGASLESTAREP
jgi:nucleoside-diphosphate-sugar epimerase